MNNLTDKERYSEPWASKWAKNHMSWITEWKDPNPAPVIERVHGDDENGIFVVRDDLLQYGSKIRGIDYIIGHSKETAHVQEWVFGSCPANGYAQISLPYVCAKYGKKAHLFMAKRSKRNLHPFQKKGLELGAIYHWVEFGMLNVTQARAREFVAKSPNTRAVFPIGLEDPSVIASFIRVAQGIPLKPDYVWTVGSSGTLNRSLQLAWPKAEVHVVGVGHTMKEKEIGRAIFHKSKYKFSKDVKPEDEPPYPSAPSYDAKVWKPMIEWYQEKEIKGKVLVWNVA